MRLMWAMLTVVAAPLAAQTAAPGEAKPFYIFFDWGKPEISRDGAAAIDAAVAAWQAAPGARLAIHGHADRSGSAAHNRRSSRVRAESVAAALAKRGVARTAMSLAAYGEERPYIATEDGVREPQNRRVEIHLIR